MEAQNRSVWRGVRPLVGSTIGVGIFALPYVFAQAGFALALAELVVIALLNTAALLLFVDLISVRKRHAHFVAVVGGELGFAGRAVAAFALFSTVWGAMLAYMIVGASFIGLLFNVAPSAAISLCFAAAGSALVAGGLPLLLRMQGFVIPAFFGVIVLIFALAVPHMQLAHFTTFFPENATLPLGALLFAVSGLSAIPEVRDSLGKHTQNMPRVLMLGMLLIVAIYLIFVIAILGFNGGATSPDAISGIVRSAGRPLALLAAAVGAMTVFSAFVTSGTSLMDTLLYDFRMKLGHAWLLAVGVPIGVFLLGARNFIDVISFTGGILGGVCGLLIIFAYEKARRSGELPKRSLRVPEFVVFLCFVLFVSMIALTMFGS